MSKSEMLHQLYKECMDIEFDESHDLIQQASSEEEKQFISIVTENRY